MHPTDPTRPALPRPHEALVAAASLAVPDAFVALVMSALPDDVLAGQEWGGLPLSVWLDDLVQRLKALSHGEDAARWGIHKLVEAGVLEPGLVRIGARSGVSLRASCDGLRDWQREQHPDLTVYARLLEQHVKSCAALQPASERQGCVPPDTFRWGEKEVAGLAPLQYRLLEALTGGGELRAPTPVEEVANHVYAGKAVSPTDPKGALCELKRRVQGLLDRCEVRLLFNFENGLASLSRWPGG
jgi:hypothetical protein